MSALVPTYTPPRIRIAERIDTREAGITHKTYVALANLETRALSGQRIHFSKVVKANRAGGNMFDQGARYDSKGN